MSPSNKSVGSDAGSQDSGDGNAGPRFVCVRERDGDGFSLCKFEIYLHAMCVCINTVIILDEF